MIGQHVPATGRAAAYGLVSVAALLGPMFGPSIGVVVTVVPSDHVGDTAPASALRARLVFVSASNLYLETGCPRKLIIVPRRDSLRLEFAEIRTAGLKEFRCEGAPRPQGDSRR